MNETEMAKENYLVGIDELKVISMFFIVILHILGHGGVINATELFSANYEVAALIESFCLCAVDCYAFTTGYLLYKKKVKLSRILKLWFEVEVYSLVIGIGSAVVTGNTLTVKQILMSLFPFLSKQYWYFTIYVGVFFLSPYLNLILQKFSRNIMKKMILTILLLVCVIPSIINFDLFETPTGSLFWMSFCYIIGGYVAKYQVKIRNPRCLYLIGALFMWGVRWIYDLLYLNVQEGYSGGVYITLNSYVSPLCVISAMGLFAVMINRKVSDVKYCRIIRKVASMSFAVYLIHDNYNFKKFIWNNSFQSYSELNIGEMVLSIIGTAIIVYSICLGFEFIRSVVLKKADKIIEKADKFNFIFEVE